MSLIARLPFRTRPALHHRNHCACTQPLRIHTSSSVIKSLVNDDNDTNVSLAAMAELVTLIDVSTTLTQTLTQTLTFILSLSSSPSLA